LYVRDAPEMSGGVPTLARIGIQQIYWQRLCLQGRSVCASLVWFCITSTVRWLGERRRRICLLWHIWTSYFILWDRFWWTSYRFCGWLGFIGLPTMSILWIGFVGFLFGWVFGDFPFLCTNCDLCIFMWQSKQNTVCLAWGECFCVGAIGHTIWPHRVRCDVSSNVL